MFDSGSQVVITKEGAQFDVGDVLTVMTYDQRDDTYFLDNGLYGEWVSSYFLELVAQPTREAYFLELSSDILLSRKGKHGEASKVVLRLFKGTRVPVLRKSQRHSETPYTCFWAGWPYTFLIGNGHKLIKVEVPVNELTNVYEDRHA